MAKKRGEPRKYTIPTSFEQARDELFSHILRCGVLEATPEHQKEWFDDTLLSVADRFTDLPRPLQAAPNPANRPIPFRAVGFTSNWSVNWARPAAWPSSLPPANATAMRVSVPGRRAMPSSAPANVWRAITAAPPTLSSVAVSCCDCNARRGIKNNRLGNGDVVTDRDIGGE